jgi:hypothetical protein
LAPGIVHYRDDKEQLKQTGADSMQHGDPHTVQSPQLRNSRSA